MKKAIPVLFITLVVIIFFWQYFIKGLIPIPADTIIGLYHPFRDLYAKNYPNGIPFKNFLITDSVRQQYPWRELVISLEKKLQLPLWNPYNYLWSIIFIFSLSSAFFAGHLQTFFYLFVFSSAYFFTRWFQFGKKKNVFLLFIILNSLFIILTGVQLIPTLQFISLSARNVDLVGLNDPGWFIPWQHLIQFVAPDFFGNPTTLNYWGVWNYGEFVGYVGITPLILALFAMFFRK